MTLAVVCAACGTPTAPVSASIEPTAASPPPTTATPLTITPSTTVGLPSQPTTSTVARQLVTWLVEDKLEITLRLRNGWQPVTSQAPPSDVDVANGLFVLQRWVVPGSPSFAALSVQRDPGDDAPVHTVPAFREVTTTSGRWRLADFGDGNGVVVGDELVVAFARIDGYLFEVTGTEAHVDTLLAQITVSTPS